MNARKVLLDSFQEICKDNKDQPLIDAIDAVLKEDAPIPLPRLVEGLEWTMQYFCQEKKDQTLIDNIDQALQKALSQIEVKKGASMHPGRQY